MRIKRIAASGLLLGLVLFAQLQHANAHVVVSDTTNKVGAILHLTPGDDPVAGGTTGIFYDIQTPVNLADAAVHLQITDDKGTIDESVVMSRDGSTTTGAFIFPIRGLYFLTLSIGPRVNGPDIEPLTFRYSVRITQSKDGHDPRPEVPIWATFGLLMSVWGLVASILVVILRRKQIASQSK